MSGRVILLSDSKLALLVSASLIAGYLVGQWGKTNYTPSYERVDATSGAFVLLVNAKFTSVELRDDFLRMVEPVCEDVRSREKGSTLSYEVAISDKDPNVVVVIERYSDKERAYLQVHKTGTEFLKFREKLKLMQDNGDVAISGESYVETGLGFV